MSAAHDQPVYTADSECYNGAKLERYSWSQNINEVDLRINVPPHIQKGKDVKVVIDKQRIQVSCVAPPDAAEKAQVTLLDEELCWPVHKEDSMWSLIPADRVVHLSLDKIQERWWEGCFKCESESERVNTREIDCSRAMTDLDDESQAKIGQMMFDQEQKRRGLPTSEQLQMHEKLRVAWDAEGSPFKGQPFDPSRVQMSTDGSAVIK